MEDAISFETEILQNPTLRILVVLTYNKHTNNVERWIDDYKYKVKKLSLMMLINLTTYLNNKEIKRVIEVVLRDYSFCSW